MALELLDGITISFLFTSRAMICAQCKPPQQVADANTCPAAVVGDSASMAGRCGIASRYCEFVRENQLFALRSSIGSVSFIRMILHSSHSPNHMKRSHARETWIGAEAIDSPEYFSDSRQKNPWWCAIAQGRRTRRCRTTSARRTGIGVFMALFGALVPDLGRSRPPISRTACTS